MFTMNLGIILFTMVVLASYRTVSSTSKGGTCKANQENTCSTDQASCKDTCPLNGDSEAEVEEEEPEYEIRSKLPDIPHMRCPDGETLCANRTTCAKRCDGVKNCYGGEDELACDGCTDRYGLLTECIEFSDSDFALIPGYSISNEFKKYGAGISVDKCRGRCLVDSQCLHFKHEPKTGACWSIFISLRYAIDTEAFKPSKRQDMYFRLCDRCMQSDDYIYKPGKK